MFDTRVFYYRTDLLDEAGYKNFPKNWDEFLDLARN